MTDEVKVTMLATAICREYHTINAFMKREARKNHDFCIVYIDTEPMPRLIVQTQSYILSGELTSTIRNLTNWSLSSTNVNYCAVLEELLINKFRVPVRCGSNRNVLSIEFSWSQTTEVEQLRSIMRDTRAVRSSFASHVSRFVALNGDAIYDHLTTESDPLVWSRNDSIAWIEPLGIDIPEILTRRMFERTEQGVNLLADQLGLSLVYNVLDSQRLTIAMENVVVDTNE